MRKIYLFIFVSLLFIWGCQESETSPVDKNFLTLEDALRFAAAQAPLSDHVNDLGNIRRIKDYLEVTPDSNLPSMYIVNYDGGGFIIIAADKRIDPILAYSEDSRFNFEDKVLPEGLLNWMEGVHNAIGEIRKANGEQGELLKRIWDRSFKQLHPITQSTRRNYAPNTRTQVTWYEGDCNNGDSGYQQITRVEPLIATWWSQGSGYNNDCPLLGCTQTSNGRAWTGCVATATGQIMRFWEFPNTFNWTQMPANDAPTAEVSRLLADLGSRLQMNYGCEGSGANYRNVKGTLASYGYPMASDGSYNYWTASDNIQGHRPVLLGGSRTTSFWIFGSKGGHLWVGDGMNEIMYYTCAADPNTPGEWIAQYTGYTAGLHMNWGWGHLADGWYASNNFNPQNVTYNVDQHQVINIRRP